MVSKQAQIIITTFALLNSVHLFSYQILERKRSRLANINRWTFFEMVCNKAMELMGSYGYSREYHVEKYMRDSTIIKI